MTRRFAAAPVCAAALALALSVPAAAQEALSDGLRDELLPLLRENAVVLNIVARVLEAGGEEVWNQANSRVTISGRPVGIRLVGEKVVIAAQFTPYFNRDGTGTLVAQGQIWFQTADGSIHYRTALQTIPIDFGEEVYFLPLGDSSPPTAGQDRLEIQLAMVPWVEEGE